MPKQTWFLIDDDDEDREIFQIALEEVSGNLNFVAARSGIEALTMLSEKAFIPDHIFLDVNMPRMTGEECLLEIRKISHLAEVPVCIYSTSRYVDGFTVPGANAVITKPSRISDLVLELKKFYF